MDDVIQSGVKTKVLMLSATPVNNRMNDLKNQVAFITEGRDDALYSQGIASIEQTLRIAQIRFNQWLRREAQERTTDSLLEALNFDYFKLLDLLTIARSRRHIEKYYDLDEIGRFPERVRPINVKADIDTLDRFPQLRDINRDIRRLNLSAYAPLKYVLPAKLAEYGRKYDRQVAGGSVFKQIDREESLIHLMRVNLLKRMESSINSFALTVERLLHQVQTLIERIDAHEDTEVEELAIEDIELEDEEFDPYLVGTKIKVCCRTSTGALAPRAGGRPDPAGQAAARSSRDRRTSRCQAQPAQGDDRREVHITRSIRAIARSSSSRRSPIPPATSIATLPTGRWRSCCTSAWSPDYRRQHAPPCPDTRRNSPPS